MTDRTLADLATDVRHAIDSGPHNHQKLIDAALALADACDVDDEAEWSKAAHAQYDLGRAIEALLDEAVVSYLLEHLIERQQRYLRLPQEGPEEKRHEQWAGTLACSCGEVFRDLVLLSDHLVRREQALR